MFIEPLNLREIVFHSVRLLKRNDVVYPSTLYPVRLTKEVVLIYISISFHKNPTKFCFLVSGVTVRINIGLVVLNLKRPVGNVISTFQALT